MSFSLTPRHWRASQWLPAVTATFLTATLIGCASPAPPQAPSLNLPTPIKDLTAQRVGNTVELRWTTPTQTTSRVPVKGPITAELCRSTTPAGPCSLTLRLQAHPGPSTASDPLPATLTSGSPTLLTYRIQLLNAHNRTAGPSNDAFAAAGSPPPAVTTLQAAPAPNGLQLTWSPNPSPAAIELLRTSLNPDGTPILPTPKTQKPSASPIAKKPQQKPPPTITQPTAPAPIETRLRTPAAATDPGGTIDHTAEKDSIYRYTAQRVLTVTLEGHTLELRSPVSQPITTTYRDIFPPRVPTGLEALPGGLSPTDRSIDLSWTPNSDSDLAGYFVYRQDVDSSGAVAATATRLNQTPVVGPAYRDQTAKPGRRYSYRVSAVDQAGNESPTSEPVQETLREQ
ncbi:MAG: fibronectin type III domain-containing protein [Edaphobacter sp.]